MTTKVTISRADRAAVLHDGAVCVVCGTDGTEYAVNRKTGEQYLNILTVDHVVPTSKSGLNHLSNMQAMCKMHNSEAQAKEVKRGTWYSPRYFASVPA